MKQQDLRNLPPGHAPRDILEEREHLLHIAQIVVGNPRGGGGVAAAESLCVGRRVDELVVVHGHGGHGVAVARQKAPRTRGAPSDPNRHAGTDDGSIVVSALFPSRVPASPFRLGARPPGTDRGASCSDRDASRCGCPVRVRRPATSGAGLSCGRRRQVPRRSTNSCPSLTKPTAGTLCLRTALSSLRVSSWRLATSLATTPAGVAGKSSNVTATARRVRESAGIASTAGSSAANASMWSEYDSGAWTLLR